MPPSHPGLDPIRLAALRRPHPATASLPARIRQHLDDHDGYVAFSGGKDSVAEDSVLYVTIDGQLQRTTPGELRQALTLTNVQFTATGQVVASVREDVRVLTSSARVQRNAQAVLRPMRYLMWHDTDESLLEISLTNGRSIRVTGDHSVMRTSRGGTSVSECRASQIVPGDGMLALTNVPDVGCTRKDAPDWLCYLAGLWMADGCYAVGRKVIIATGGNTQLLEFLRAIPRTPTGVQRAAASLALLPAGQPVTAAIRRDIATQLEITPAVVAQAQYRGPQRTREHVHCRTTPAGDAWLHSRALVDALVDLDMTGTSRTKAVPAWLFAAPRNQISSFLAGYLDGDGSYDHVSGLTAGSVNAALIAGIRELLWRLGIKHGISTRTATTPYGTHTMHNVSVNSVEGRRRLTELPFRRLRPQVPDSRTRPGGAHDFQVVSVKSVKRLPSVRRRVYDFETGNSMFVADGVLVHNSLAVLHQVLTVEPNVPVLFFDSGLEFPETYRYLEQLHDQLHLQLQVLPARQTTLHLLAASGAWDHTAPRQPTPDLHQVLITEPAARAHQTHGPGELWGVRAEESRGRAALYATALRTETVRSCHDCCTDDSAPARARRRRHGGLVRRVDGTVALGPIWDWKTPDVWAYLARHQLPVNPVYAKLRRLGAPEHMLRVSHMVDGNRLEEGRVTWLRRGWPELFEDLSAVLPRLREFV